MRTSAQRLTVVLMTSTALLFAGAVPASAMDSPEWNAPYPYTLLETLGLFVGIPLTVFAIVVLAVFAPGWARSDKAEKQGQPVWETSPAGSMTAPSGPGIITPSGPTDHTEPGGASARW